MSAIPNSLRDPESRRLRADQRRLDRRHRRYTRLYPTLAGIALWALIGGIVAFKPDLSLVRGYGVTLKSITLDPRAWSEGTIPTYWELCSRQGSSPIQKCVYDALRIPGNPPAGQLQWGDLVQIPVYR